MSAAFEKELLIFSTQELEGWCFWRISFKFHHLASVVKSKHEQDRAQWPLCSSPDRLQSHAIGNDIG